MDGPWSRPPAVGVGFDGFRLLLSWGSSCSTSEPASSSAQHGSRREHSRFPTTQPDARRHTGIWRWVERLRASRTGQRKSTAGRTQIGSCRRVGGPAAGPIWEILVRGGPTRGGRRPQWSSSRRRFASSCGSWRQRVGQSGTMSGPTRWPIQWPSWPMRPCTSRAIPTKWRPTATECNRSAQRRSHSGGRGGKAGISRGGSSRIGTLDTGLRSGHRRVRTTVDSTYVLTRTSGPRRYRFVAIRATVIAVCREPKMSRSLSA
jgi:hypothetical protein